MVKGRSKIKKFSITSYMIAAVILSHVIVIPFLYQMITQGYKDSFYVHYISHVTLLAGLLADVVSRRSQNAYREDIINVLDTSILGGNIQFI